MASTSNLFARHTRLVSPIVFFSAVLLLLVGASPWSQAAPTTLSPTTICTNTAVSSLKILGSISNLRKDFCDAEKNYVKVRKRRSCSSCNNVKARSPPKPLSLYLSISLFVFRLLRNLHVHKDAKCICYPFLSPVKALRDSQQFAHNMLVCVLCLCL